MTDFRAFFSGQLDWQYLHYRNAIGWTVLAVGTGYLLGRWG